MPARPDPRRSFGSAGERLAAHFLEQRGYRILDRNVRLSRGEIDLVAEQGNCLILVEVRLRRHAGSGEALESIGRIKQARLRRLAAEYVARLEQPARAVRIDVVAIALDAAGRLRDIALVQNAVEDE